MKVHHDEGVAKHINPESCAGTREGAIAPSVYTKGHGKQRPLAVAALENKIVQKTTGAVLNCIYEVPRVQLRSVRINPGKGKEM